MAETGVSSGFERIDAIAGDLVAQCEMLWQAQAEQGIDTSQSKQIRAAVAKLKTETADLPPDI